MRKLRTMRSVLALALVAAVRPACAQLPPIGVTAAPTAAESGGVVSVRLRPDTVTVGEPFELQLRAIATPGRIARAPAVPDTGGLVEPLDPARTSRRGDTLLVTYRLIAWQPGVLTIPLLPVAMQRGASEVLVPVDARVVVRSVLPADTATRVPKPPRDLFVEAPAWWQRWWQWVAAVVALLMLVWLVERWRTRRRARVQDTGTPIGRAEAAFVRLDARQLVIAGEGARHVALAGEIVREYLAAVEPRLSLALTSAEVLRAVSPIAGISDTQLAHVLRKVDAVRFSGRLVPPSVVQDVSGAAREFIRDVEQVRSTAQGGRAA